MFLNCIKNCFALLLIVIHPLHGFISGTENMPVPTELYAPWRSNYEQSLNNPKNTSVSELQKKSVEEHPKNTETKPCVFCKAVQEPASDLVLAQTKSFILLLNKHPYAPGHFLIVPRQHVRELKGLSEESRQELIELISDSIETLSKQLQCSGVNVGANIGEYAGVSIPDHLHFHIVPRNKLEIGFIQTACNTNVVCCDFKQLLAYLSPHFHKMAEKYNK